uniref:ACP24A4 n=1 Tax=Drosophila melanogaster TaxID=7227 RepID=Q45WF1_DROME|nr:ACP24A4 [Drosophila melanogaster]
MKLLILLFVFIALASNSLALKNEICGLPAAANGNCLALFSRWSCDAQYNVCFNFIYGGCQGNDNSFESQEECINKCVE